MAGPEEFLKGVQAADDAAYQAQLAFLNGPEAYLEYLRSKMDATLQRLEAQYERATATNRRMGTTSTEPGSGPSG